MTRNVEYTLTRGDETFDLVIEYSVARAEPDVGIMSDYIDEWWLPSNSALQYTNLTEAEKENIETFLSEIDIDD